MKTINPPIGWVKQNARHKNSTQSRRETFRQIFGDNLWLDVAHDLISGMAVDQGDADIRVKYGDSWSNRSQDIRAARFVVGDGQRTTSDVGFGNRQKCHWT